MCEHFCETGAKAMSYFVCLGLSSCNVDSMIDAINPCKTFKTKILKRDKVCFAVSFHENSPLKGKRYFENKNWIAVFAGDLIEGFIPWKLVLEALENENYKVFAGFNGYFSFAALNKKDNRVFVVSDRRSQLPVFYLINDTCMCISTELLTFSRLPIEMQFDPEWLWELLFFLHPIGQTTFFKNVRRMPPASILETQIESKEHRAIEYTSKFLKKDDLLEGKDALEHCYDVFRNVIPRYFVGSKDVAISLTAGLDTRTILSFCPRLDNVTAYTYGTPGCSDLVEASKIAHALNIKHQMIPFDKDFEEQLPSLIFETIYVSSALEGVTRSSLLYIYRSLTDAGKKYPLILSGIDLDSLFRGSLGVLRGTDMGRTFTTGEKCINEVYWEELMGDSYKRFKRCMMERLDTLEAKYGRLDKPESSMSYSIYEFSPKYFGGELAIAKHFSTLRVPAWDNEIIDLSFSVKCSALSFSKSLRNYNKNPIDEMTLQAYMISKNAGPLGEIPVYGVSPNTFSKGKIACTLVRTMNLGANRIKSILLNRPSYIPLGNWDKWLNVTLEGTINNLLFKHNSMIKHFVNPKYLDSLRNNLSDPIIAKLVRAEIILRSFFNNQKDTFYRISS